MFASERLAGALLDRITHHVHILEMNADSYRLKAEPIAATAPVRITPLAPVGSTGPSHARRPPPAAHRARRPRARGPPLDYADKLPPKLLVHFFAPPAAGT